MERMPYSLGGAVLGRTSVGRVLSVRGCGWVCPCSRGSRRGAPRPTSSSLRGGGVPQALTVLGGARYITWFLRHPFLRWMPAGPEAFLEPPGLFRLRPWAQTHIKSPLASLVWLIGRAINTDNLQAAWQYWKDIPNCCITPVFCIIVLLL